MMRVPEKGKKVEKKVKEDNNSYGMKKGRMKVHHLSSNSLNPLHSSQIFHCIIFSQSQEWLNFLKSFFKLLLFYYVDQVKGERERDSVERRS